MGAFGLSSGNEYGPLLIRLKRNWIVEGWNKYKMKKKRGKTEEFMDEMMN